jgi:hypothetical protein
MLTSLKGAVSVCRLDTYRLEEKIAETGEIALDLFADFAIFC